MDVDTGLLTDPKLRRLARAHPDLFPLCVTAFIAVLAESWRAGERRTVEEAWPLLIPADPARVEAVTDALRLVGLVGADGRISEAAWAAHFGPAQRRREALRVRWERANRKRAKASPRGYRLGTTAVPRAVPPPPSGHPSDEGQGTTAGNPGGPPSSPGTQVPRSFEKPAEWVDMGPKLAAAKGARR